MPVLARGDAPRGEAPAVAHAIDVINNRNLGVAGQQKVGVQGMGRPVLDGTDRRNQGLSDHLATEHALPADLRRAAAEQVLFQRLEIENIEQILDGGRHDRAWDGSKYLLNLL